MKPKKSAKASLENKRGLFLQVGLLISLLLVVLAFEWESTPEYNTSFGRSIEDIIIDPDIIVMREKKIEPVVIHKPKISDVLNIMPDDIELDDELFPLDTEIDPLQGFNYSDLPDEVNEEDAFPEYDVNVPASFQGNGVEGFRIWVVKNLVYPSLASESNISGRVYLQFTVSSKGYVKDVIVVRGVHPSLDQEAVRVISSSPRWEPAERMGRDVGVIIHMPINFRLE